MQHGDQGNENSIFQDMAGVITIDSSRLREAGGGFGYEEFLLNLHAEILRYG
jgi:hypothetical protein